MPGDLLEDAAAFEAHQIVGEPLVLDGQESEEGGFADALPAHQRQHVFELAAGLVDAPQRPDHKHLHALMGQIILRRAEEVAQRVADALGAVPLQLLQVVPDGVKAVLIGGGGDGAPAELVRSQIIVAGHVAEDVVHIVVIHGGTGATPAHVLLDLQPTGHAVQPHRAVEQRVLPDNRLAILDDLGDVALLVVDQLFFQHFDGHQARCQGVELILRDGAPIVRGVHSDISLLRLRGGCSGAGLVRSRCSCFSSSACLPRM